MSISMNLQSTHLCCLPPTDCPKGLKMDIDEEYLCPYDAVEANKEQDKDVRLCWANAYCEQDTLPTRSRAYHGMHCVWPVRFKQVHTGSLSSPWVDRTDGQWWRTGAHHKENITCRRCVNMCEHTLYHSPHALCVMRFNFQPTVKPTSTRLKPPRMILLIVKSWQPKGKTRMILEMNQFLHWPHATYQRIAPQYRNCPDVACQPFAGTSRVEYLYAKT